VAETVGPSVRGALRVQVLGLLAVTAAGTGALAGWVLGLLWLGIGLPGASSRLAVAVAAVTIGLEVLGRPRPLALRRQVPQLWGRILGERTVAVLYGARLGVGPLTVLPTWLWWGSAVAGAAAGPWVGAAAGAAYGLARILTSIGATTGVTSGGAMACRIGRVRSVDRPARLVAVLVVAVLTVTGCRGGDDASSRPIGGTVRPATTTTVPFTPELRTVDDLLVDDAIDGFRRDDAALGAGPLDLEAAARAEADVDAERSLLETRGFVRGLSRGWVGPHDAGVYLAVYEFATPAGAAAYLVDGMEHVLARGGRELPVSDIAGARGFAVVEGGVTSEAVTFARGSRWVLVVLADPSGSLGVQPLVELAERQASALPA
jgi:hypothetical protein